MPKKKKVEEEVIIETLEEEATVVAEEAPKEEVVTVKICGQEVTGKVDGNKITTSDGVTYDLPK